jgi:hypothetical protein
MQEGSSEDIREVRIHLDAENSVDTVYAYNTYGDITQSITYDGSSIIRQVDVYYASYKLLSDMEDVDNWVETGDGALSDNTGGFPDGTDTLRNTYTFSGGTSSVADSTTNHGDLSNWIGASCNTGYVSLFAKFSDYTNVTSVELRIGSSSVDYRSVTVYSGIDYTTNNKFFPLDFGLSGGSATGTPNGAAVDYVALVFTIASGASQTIDMRALMVSKENATKITGENFYNIRRQVETWTSESKNYSYILFYDESENIQGKLLGGAY